MKNYRPDNRGHSGGSRLRTIAIMAFLAFVAGGVLTVWAAQKLEIFSGKSEIAAVDKSVKPEGPIEVAPGLESLPPPIAPAGGGQVAEQVDDLEQRMSRINAEAQAASGNAARAEGMLVAFAARRAIESGASLGYIETQLQTRFAASQPHDVATIVNAAKNPVTLDLLRAELSTQGDSWLAQDGLSAWARFQKELGELFVIRKETTLSPAPTRMLDRARQYTEVGNIEAAIKEVKQLPGAKQAKDWLVRANHYTTVRKSLDNIERAALARPAEVIAPAAGPVATKPVQKPVAEPVKTGTQ